MNDSQLEWCTAERESGSPDALFRAAFAEAPIGMAVVTPDGTFVCVNRALCEIVGYPESDLLAVNMRELTHPDDIGNDASERQRLLAGEIRSYRKEQRWFHRRGRTLWVSMSVAPARDEPGGDGRLIVQFQDVTTDKRADASMREANARLRALFDYAPAWLSLRGLDGRYLNANDQLLRQMQANADELIGSHPGALIDSTMAAQIHADDTRVWETRAPVTREIVQVGDDGELHTHHVIHYPVLDDDGEVTAFGTFALDITERRALERAREEALAAFEEAQRITKVGSWTWQRDTALTTWSREMYRIFGLDPHSATPVPVPSLLDYALPEDRERVREGLRSDFGGGDSFEVEYRIRAADGAERFIRVLGRRDPDQPDNYAGTCQDVTEVRAVEIERRVAEERFRRSFDHAPVGMALIEPSGEFMQVNDAMCRLVGYEAEELIGRRATELIHEDDLEGGRERRDQLRTGEIDHYQRELRLIRSSGEPVWISLHLSLVRDSEDRPLHGICQVLDITERRRLERELRHLADHDPLTGLLNRRGFESELERHVAHVNRYGAHGALLVVDLDHFKAVNDTLGHEAGDLLIQSVAQILSARLRDSDTVARLGGDEFAILLPEADAASAESVAATLVTDIHDHAVATGGPVPRQVTASIGVTVFETGIESAAEALVDADTAMYEAKQAGRDRLSVHATGSTERPQPVARHAWIARIRDALDNDRLNLLAQPFIELRSGEVHGHELLLRLVEAEGESIPPGAFLCIAERYDLIQELDCWVASQAIRMIESDRMATPGGLIAVNVSSRSIADDQLLTLLERELARKSIDPSRLVFELTETAAIANVQLARRFAEALDRLGCGFALDDFGAGFGSFYYLKHIPFDYLKIDAELISRCRAHHTDRLVVESLVTIARGLNKRTIAEGVEDAETMSFLQGAGVDFVQGYHTGHPAPTPPSAGTA